MIVISCVIPINHHESPWIPIPDSIYTPYSRLIYNIIDIHIARIDYNIIEIIIFPHIYIDPILHRCTWHLLSFPVRSSNATWWIPTPRAVRCQLRRGVPWACYDRQVFVVIFNRFSWWFNGSSWGDLMGFHGDFMGFHGDLMGFHGDLMGIQPRMRTTYRVIYMMLHWDINQK